MSSDTTKVGIENFNLRSQIYNSNITLSLFNELWCYKISDHNIMAFKEWFLSIHWFQIPLIDQAKSLGIGGPLKLIASCWTAPPWMKTFPVWQGFSQLRKENYQLFALYMKRFLEEYEKRGIDFWGLTTGNEPLSGFFRLTQTKVNSMGWIPSEQVENLILSIAEVHTELIS